MLMSFLSAIRKSWNVAKKNNIDILFLSHRYNVTSGGEKALLDMIRYVVSIGLKPHVIIGSHGDIVDHLDELSVPYSIVYLPFWVHGEGDSSEFIFTSLNPTVSPVLQIVELIKKLQPKLCVTNTMVIPWLGYAAAITGTHHAWMIHELGTDGFRFQYALGEKETLRNIDNLSDKIFYNSQYTANYYIPQLTFNKEAPVIYPAGDAPKPHATTSPFTTNGIKLICVGQIKEQKGQLDVVRAVHHLKGVGLAVELLLVGDLEDPQYPKKLKQYVQSHELEESVRFLGYQDNPADFMQHADIVINCAINESFGRVTVEGMLLEKPVIGAASAGTVEILDSKKHGLLYPPGDFEALAKHIEYLYKNPIERKKIGKSARSVVLKRYSAEKRYKPFMDYYSNLPQKTGLDLELLGATIADFSATVSLYRNAESEIRAIKSGRLWRVSQLAKKIKRKIIP